MTATLLAICCCSTAAIFVFSLTSVSRSYRQTIAACPSTDAQHLQEPTWGVGLTKSQAEDLLDWLEANGRKGKLTFVSGQGFNVC